MKRVFKLFIFSTLLISMLLLSSCIKLSFKKVEYNYYVEEYDGNTVKGENAFYEFYVKTTIQNKKAQILIKKTYILDKEGVSEEYYNEHKHEYPKTYEIRVSYNGNEFLKENLTENYRSKYKYLNYELTRSTHPGQSWNTADNYLLTDDANYYYTNYLKDSLSAILIPNRSKATPIYSKYYYKNIHFSNSEIHSIDYYNNTHVDLELKIYLQNKLLAYMDSLTYESAKDLDFDNGYHSKPDGLFKNNILSIYTTRTLKKNSDDNLIKFYNDLGEVGLTYRIDLQNGIVILDYIAVSTNIHSLYSKINISDKYFFDILNELNLTFDYSIYLKPGKYVHNDSNTYYTIRSDGTFDYCYSDGQKIYENHKYYIINNKLILTNFNTSGINHQFNLIYDINEKSIYHGNVKYVCI